MSIHSAFCRFENQRASNIVGILLRFPVPPYRHRDGQQDDADGKRLKTIGRISAAPHSVVLF
jgi:hypothetical protein